MMQFYELGDHKDNKNKLIRKTCEYLQKNLNETMVLDDIALRMGTNRSKLSTIFKQEVGETVFHWIRKQRMNKAKSLLQYTDLSIQQVGFEVGYLNSANFSTSYRKFFGLSPREERRNRLNQK